MFTLIVDTAGTILITDKAIKLKIDINLSIEIELLI
tara:strand:- start:615 stop:722 length:108 start_codon:yes stop_codon:yes gene_type:complete